MCLNLHDKSVKVLAVCNSTSMRQTVVESLWELGFKDVVTTPTLAEAMDVLGSEPIGWLITPSEVNNKSNVLQLLQLILCEPHLRNLKVSLIYDKGEEPIASKAFDLGLLSAHEHAVNKTAMLNDFSSLLDQFTESDENLTLTSYWSLRILMKKSKRLAELFDLDKRLFSMYPDHAELVLNIAESEYLNGNHSAGKRTVNQALLLKPDLAERAKTIIAAAESEKPPAIIQKADEAKNLLGINSCLILDPEAKELAKCVEYAKILGIPEVQAFAKPQDAIKFLQKQAKVELIIFEWALPVITGPAFLQRVRKLLGLKVPLVVTNRSVSEDDAALFREMGITSAIRKPFESSSFMKELIWVIQQDRRPNVPRSILIKLRQALAAKDSESVQKFRQAYFEDPKVTLAQKKQIDAEIAYYFCDFQGAKDFAIQALQLSNDAAATLNLLGKALMKLGDFDGALRCLENAQTVSPLNIERLCTMAETHLDAGNDSGFEQTLTKAQAMDPENDIVVETAAKGAIAKNDTQKARQLMHRLVSLESVLSFTNNRGVSLIKIGDFDKGISLYREALQAIPADRKETLALVHYNLGLAFAKIDNTQEALQALDTACLAQNPKLRSKASNLKERIEEALRMKVVFQLNTSDQESILTSQKPDDIKNASFTKGVSGFTMDGALALKAGELCCHKIYIDGATPPEVTKLFSTAIKFTKKDSLQREATFGMEKTNFTGPRKVG